MELIKLPQLLLHYDSTRSSPSHAMLPLTAFVRFLHIGIEDGSERMIEYASQTLSPAEGNYAQIDKEALAIAFRVKQHLYGWKFTICSDHKPLMYIFGENQGISQTASAQVQWWALTLMRYQYTIVHRHIEKLANADGLSRLPVLYCIKMDIA